MSAPESASVTYEVIGVVRSPFASLDGMPLQSVAAEDVRGRIELHSRHRAALKDLEGFSHVWVFSHLHRSEPSTESVVLPFLDDVERGLFATRSPRHPNPIGLSVVRLLQVENATLHVSGLDLLDGTPVLDLKPYVPLFDCIDAERIGWLKDKAEKVHAVRADRRFEHQPVPDTEAERLPRVCDVMNADPKTLPPDTTVGDVRRFFENHSVLLALLVHDDACTGAINRTDIPADARDDDAAALFAQIPRTIQADASLAEAHRRLGQTADRRLVVVDHRNRLRGLLCHNHAGNGFCNDKSSCRRRGETTPKKTRWQIIHWSGSPERKQPAGLLLAAEGKSISIGDLLTLPPDTQTRWLVIDVEDKPHDEDSGIVTVSALDRHEATLA
jgi:tRNA-Thr(GGU) m(6)t(6)A37 methyltransferase TsaA